MRLDKMAGTRIVDKRSLVPLDVAKIKFDGSFIDYYLPILGILQYYSTGATGSYGSLVLYFYAAIELLLSIGRRPIYFHKGLILFSAYALVSQPIVFSIYGGFTSARLFNFISVIYIVLVLAVFSDSLNIDRFFKVYLRIGFIASAAIVIQSVQLYIFHQDVHGIALLPCDTSGWYSGGDRPCGLFPEPSVYAYYILPLLVLCLQREKKEMALLFTACICMSTSSMGIISSAFIWAYWLLKRFDVRRVIVGCVAIAAAFVLAMQTPMGRFAFDKIVSTDYANSPRLTRGFLIYANLNESQQLFGIGRNNLDYFISNDLVQLTDWASTQVSEANLDYVTTVSGVLINYGLVGAILYFVPLLYMLRKKGVERILLLLFLMLSFVQTMFFDMNFVFLLLVVFNLHSKDDSFIECGAAFRLSDSQRKRFSRRSI